jgi:hypothetical protein
MRKKRKNENRRKNVEKKEKGKNNEKKSSARFPRHATAPPEGIARRRAFVQFETGPCPAKLGIVLHST